MKRDLGTIEGSQNWISNILEQDRIKNGPVKSLRDRVSVLDYVDLATTDLGPKKNYTKEEREKIFADLDKALLKLGDEG